MNSNCSYISLSKIGPAARMLGVQTKSAVFCDWALCFYSKKVLWMEEQREPHNQSKYYVGLDLLLPGTPQFYHILICKPEMLMPRLTG